MYSYDLLIAAPNSAIDSYYELSSFEIGEVNKAFHTFHTAGGKGLNAARALRNLGGKGLCTGIVAGSAGQFIVNELNREEIAHDLVWSPGESRRCNTIRIDGCEDTTIVLETGIQGDESIIFSFTERVLTHALDAPFTVLMGSLPSGFPEKYYQELIQQLKMKGVKVCIDSSGPGLFYAIESGPWLVKINCEEFQSVFLSDSTSISWQNIQQIYGEMREKGVEILVITDGKNGAYIFSPDGDVIHVITPVEKIISSAGSGDTFLAALLLAMGRGENLEKAISFASAAAAANLLELGCGFFDPKKVSDLIAETRIARNPWS
jgi:tagatose 6-phosphate kinase